MFVYPLVHKARDQVRDIVWKAIFQSGIQDRIVTHLIHSAESRAWLIHQLAVYQTQQQVGFDAVPLDVVDKIRGFEDCYWLFASNEMNMGLSQLHFDDAAFIYRWLSNRAQTRVVELGRYKGGTTFLLAAAGAQVLSLEYDPQIDHRYLPSLLRALDHFGLAGRVDARQGDAYTFPLKPHSVDMVLVHCSPPSYDHTRVLVEHWWPALVPGGYLVMHETPHLPGEQAFIADMRNAPADWHAAIESDVPGENVFFRKLEDQSVSQPSAETAAL